MVWNSTFKNPQKPMRRSRIRRTGKKSLDWMRVRRMLSERFKAAGIVTCEVRISRYCTPTMMLTWAHGKKYLTNK